MNFYETVKRFCEQKSMSIPQMCEKAGISCSIVYDIKRGRKSGVNRKTAEKIAAALEITVSELYNEKSPGAVAPREQEAIELLKQLNAEDYKEALSYLSYLANKK